jgi:hypothetical protein
LNRRRNRLFVSTATLALVGAMLVAAPVVSAQSAGGDQYNPGGGVGPAGGADNGPGDDGTGPTGGELQANPAGTGESGGGELPFTGYPLTPLVLAVILLVALGLAFRLTSEWRHRISAAADTTSG